MDRIAITGGQPLNGEITIDGAKNAALPLLAATLLTGDSIRLSNIPDLADIRFMLSILRHLGAEVSVTPAEAPDLSQSVQIQTSHLATHIAPYDMVRKMRASVLVLGPLLARFGQARVSLPGGCVIGARPIDMHLEGLQRMGAKITLDQGYVDAKAPADGLKGADITLPQPSVGASENLMMAAALANGQSRILNVAREPEITELAELLQAMGAKIDGIGTSELTITGVSSLQGTDHRVRPDRIVAGSYMMAAAATRGQVLLKDAPIESLTNVFDLLKQAGVKIETVEERNVLVSADQLDGIDLMTEPYPGFPTDLQAQFMALMVCAKGASMITETIFENRFMHVPELQRLGANINFHGGSAIVRGVDKLRAAPVMATDIRASLSLIIAALIAEGETIVHRVYHLDRGYAALVRKLSACGAQISRLSDR